MTTSPSRIECPKCSKPTPADRVGAQYECDVYICKEEHITMIRVNGPRKVWDELGSTSSKSSQ